MLRLLSPLAVRAFFGERIVSVDAAQRVVVLLPLRLTGAAFVGTSAGLAAYMLWWGHRGSVLSAVLLGLFALLYWSLYVSKSGSTVTIDFDARTLSIDPPYGIGRPVDARFEDLTVTCTESTHRRKYGRLAPAIDVGVVRDAGTRQATTLFEIRVYDRPAAIVLVRELARAMAEARTPASDFADRARRLSRLEDHAAAIGEADWLIDFLRFAMMMFLGIVPALAFSR
jgi:hypothetical protein